MFHDVGKFIPFLKLSPNIIRATNFIEESVTRYHIKGFLIRIKLRNCLHDIELSIGNTCIFIVCEKILKSLHKLTFLAAGKRRIPYCPERNARIEDMKRTLEAAKEAGVTAVIASDMAAIMYARQLGVEVHISTQLSISNAEALRFYAQFADVIVLARELNLQQVKEIKAIIDRDNICGPSGRLVEIEMFAHGALCMAVSGKCYLSLHEYGASANRGSCFQICRRAYDVRDRETGAELTVDNKYIMSPKDLCTIEFMDKIIDAGVTVFKIEGRARSAEYVKRVASCYRRAADAVCEGRYTTELAAELKNELEEVFNRGFWDGYYQGARLGEWSEVYGSRATRKKVYSGKVTNWFGKLGVAEILIESRSLKVGDKILVIGPTSGCVEYTVPEIRVDLKPVQEASKGVFCSIPIDWSKVVPGAREEELGLCGDGCSEDACKAIQENRLRRSDKVYIWTEE